MLLPYHAESLGRDLKENWHRVSSAFPALENAYFLQREALLEEHARQAQQAQHGAQQSGEQQEPLQLDTSRTTEDHISAFSQDLTHFCRHNKLTVSPLRFHSQDCFCMHDDRPFFWYWDQLAAASCATGAALWIVSHPNDGKLFTEMRAKTMSLSCGTLH